MIFIFDMFRRSMNDNANKWAYVLQYRSLNKLNELVTESEEQYLSIRLLSLVT